MNRRKLLASFKVPLLTRQRKNVNTLGDERDFQVRLTQTRLWCSREGRGEDPRFSLRSPELRPEILTEVGSDTYWNYQNKDIVGNVNRIVELRLSKLNFISRKANDEHGKLLAFWPEENLDCGAAEANSRGYFNVGNVPPWDTWFWYGQFGKQPSALISWVPADMVSLVDAGIWANPEQCIQWMK